MLKVLSALAAVLAGTALLGADSEKLTQDQRIELIRGLSSEFATAKVLIPRSKKTLDFPADGKFDKNEWAALAKEVGPAARQGDLVQITKVTIDDDKLVLELNNGAKGKHRWYEHVSIGMGNSTTPIAQGSNTLAPGGTTIALVFDKQLPAVPAADYKKMLAPILDFERRSATEQLVDTYPPEIKQAIKAKRATEGMDRDQVLLALGRPRHKQRETRDGEDYEDWVYGMPPGKITFVTFKGTKVVQVKDAYAGLGGQTAPPLQPQN